MKTIKKQSEKEVFVPCTLKKCSFMIKNASICKIMQDKMEISQNERVKVVCQITYNN
jgi:hypothetical protein